MSFKLSQYSSSHSLILVKFTQILVQKNNILIYDKMLNKTKYCI